MTAINARHRFNNVLRYRDGDLTPCSHLGLLVIPREGVA